VTETAVKSSVDKKAVASRKPKDRAKILAKIDALIANGASTLKDALVKADISKRTYYTWKREEPVAGSTGNDKASKQPSKTPSAKPVESETSFVDDLAKLEAENQALKKELGEKLRAENEELKRRLGK
jgi:putative transposase